MVAWPESINVPVERFVPETGVLQEKALEVHAARRERAPEGPPLDQAYCEVALAHAFGLPFKPAYMRRFPKSLQVILMDDLGRTIRVISSSFWPKRVYDHRLDVDLLVFASKLRVGVELYGWLTVEEVRESPRVVVGKSDGEDLMAHVVERETMNPLPDSWDFERRCPHDGNTIWNDQLGAAECCLCGFAFNSKVLRDRWDSMS